MRLRECLEELISSSNEFESQRRGGRHCGLNFEKRADCSLISLLVAQIPAASCTAFGILKVMTIRRYVRIEDHDDIINEESSEDQRASPKRSW